MTQRHLNTEALKTALASSATLALALLAWELLVNLLRISPQVLPGPKQVGQALWQGWVSGTFWPHISVTLQGALGGCAIGSGLGFATGIAVASNRRLQQALYPVVIAVQSMPTVAVAPLIVVYFGVDLASKLVTVALLCFFPLFVNTVAGLHSADPRLLDLFRAASASRWRVLMDVQIPGCVPHLIAGIQVAVVLSFIGCVVSEFVASRAGIGHLIKTYANDLNVAVMFACIVTLALLGGGTGYALNRLRDRARVRLRI